MVEFNDCLILKKNRNKQIFNSNNKMEKEEKIIIND